MPSAVPYQTTSAGLSAAVITRLTGTWQAEQRAFAERDLSAVDYVYLWADGIYVNIRLEEHKLCLLVMIGVRADGRKELIALADGYRESAESWATCCAIARAAGCAPRCWPSVMARWGGSRAAGQAMAFKLIESAQDRWRAVNPPHLVALVRAGRIFINGKLAERPQEAAA